MDARDREQLQAHIFLRALLPLLEVVVETRPAWRERLSRTDARIGVHVQNTDLGVHLDIAGHRLGVHQGVHPAPDLSFSFASTRALNNFFAGRPVVPRVRGALRHPVLCGLFVWLISQLRILSPSASRSRPGERALYVELVLYFITEALAEMNRAGHPDMRWLTRGSPERVYQWLVEDASIGAYLHIEDGRATAGRGVYTERRAFVKYTFPTIDSAFRVFTTKDSQMASVARGDVRPEGSPEYSRKISVAMQRAEALLIGR